MKVFLGMACYRAVQAGTVQSLMGTQLQLLMAGHDLEPHFLVGDALVSRARSRLAQLFLDSGAEVWLSLDDDIVIDPRDAVSLCVDALDHEGIVGAFYLTRSHPPQPAVLLPDDTEILLNNPAHDLVPVTYLASGCMAIHRSVVEGVSRLFDGEMDGGLVDTDGPIPYRPLFMPMVNTIGGTRVYLSEDWAFQWRAWSVDHDVPILLDPSVHLEHIGEHRATVEELLRSRPPHPKTPITIKRTGGVLNVGTDHYQEVPSG